MSESEVHPEIQHVRAILDWAVERLVRVILIVAMLGLFAPLFTQSLAGLPTIGPIELRSVSPVVAALYSAVTVVVAQDVLSVLVSRSDIVDTP